MDQNNNQPNNPNPVAETPTMPQAPMMDNTVPTPNPATPPSAQPMPAVPQPETATPPAPQNASKSSSGTNKTLLIVAGVFVFALGAMGVTMYMMSASNKGTTSIHVSEAPVAQTQVAPTATPSPTPAASDINSLTVPDPSSDVNSIGQDVNQL